jgi:hypothetical protein
VINGWMGLMGLEFAGFWDYDLGAFVWRWGAGCKELVIQDKVLRL